MPKPDKLPRGATRLTAAVPGALTAVLLVGAVAFGATSLRSAAPAADTVETTIPALGSEAKHALDHDWRHADPKPTAAPAKPTASAAPKPAEEPKPSPKEETKQVAEQPAATAKPKPAPAQPKPTTKPQPKPASADPVAMALEGWVKDGKVKLAWKPFGGDGFEYYKVVRSTDATVTWPAGSGDTVIGVIGDPNASWWADKPACGSASSYRAFAVRSGEGGYVTLGASNVVTLTAPCAPDPTPHVVKPITLAAEVRAGEGIKLSWGSCPVDGFAAYKVVRSMSNADPRYPVSDGTELIAAIGDAGQLHLLDGGVAPGETWTYRVLVIGDAGHGMAVLCESAAVSATAQ
jgi:hypothetical protein